MTGSVPLLLVDVDGVISLFGFDQSSLPPGRFVVVDGIPHLISEAAGPLLARLAHRFECVWCTGWEDRADEHLPALLDLEPGWPHLRFGTVGEGERHWKLAAIDAFAGPERPLAWIDDAHDDTCHAWATARPGPTLLVATEPANGLMPAHVEEIEAWARALRRDGPA